MIYGYARVSTRGQARDGNSLENQREKLREAGASKIYCDAYTGTKKNRPELDKLMVSIGKGDTLVVCKLDRIARSTQNGLEIIQSLRDKGVKVNVLNMGIIDDTPTGNLIMTVMLAFAQFERDMIIMRTTEGKETARDLKGKLYREGRKPTNVELIDKVTELVDSGASMIQACKNVGISRSTYYKYAKQI